jgi:hypothetical protein
MHLITESFAITVTSFVIFTQFCGAILIPSVIYRIYNFIGLESSNIWIILANIMCCLLGSLFQELMIRTIKKRFGYMSILMFTISIPLTYYNLMFSDPAPYFTLCFYGCFSIENCATNDIAWTKFISLSTVFGLALMLSVEVLAISLSSRFIKLSVDELRDLMTEACEKYGLQSQSDFSPNKLEEYERSYGNIFAYEKTFNVLKMDKTGNENKHEKLDNGESSDRIPRNNKTNALRNRRFLSEFCEVAVIKKPKINLKNSKLP